MITLGEALNAGDVAVLKSCIACLASKYGHVGRCVCSATCVRPAIRSDTTMRDRAASYSIRADIAGLVNILQVKSR